jgi:hypothetical protein
LANRFSAERIDVTKARYGRAIYYSTWKEWYVRAGKGSSLCGGIWIGFWRDCEEQASNAYNRVSPAN